MLYTAYTYTVIVIKMLTLEDEEIVDDRDEDERRASRVHCMI